MKVFFSESDTDPTTTLTISLKPANSIRFQTPETQAFLRFPASLMHMIVELWAGQLIQNMMVVYVVSKGNLSLFGIDRGFYGWTI